LDEIGAFVFNKTLRDGSGLHFGFSLWSGNPGTAIESSWAGSVSNRGIRDKRTFQSPLSRLWRISRFN